MKTTTRKRLCAYSSIGIFCVSLVLFSGCSSSRLSEDPSMAQQGYGNAPTLSNLSASPNPTSHGNIVTLTTNYVDPEADLHSGLAAISVNGENLSSTTFRAVYPSGILSIPFTVSHYTRQSDISISLKIRDDAGNWSNAVSTVLSVR
jgi:hypothetical protein